MVDLSLGRNEELRTPLSEGRRWEDEVPTRLTVNAGYDDDGTPDVDRKPVAVFANDCLRFREGEATIREHVRTAFNEFMHDHDRQPRDFDDNGVTAKFGKRLSRTMSEHWEDITRTNRDGRAAYKNLEFTQTGREYLESAMEGLEDSSAPVTGR
jgi:hypothetical protein